MLCVGCAMRAEDTTTAPAGVCSAPPPPGAQWLVATEDGSSPEDAQQVISVGFLFGLRMTLTQSCVAPGRLHASLALTCPKSVWHLACSSCGKPKAAVCTINLNPKPYMHASFSGFLGRGRRLQGTHRVQGLCS